MSDTLLGVIIGGAVALIVSVVGNLILGYFSTRKTTLEFDYQKKEKQTERLINIRAKYLDLICENLKSIISSAHHIETKLHDLIMLCNYEEVIAWADSRSVVHLNSMTMDINSISKSMNNIEMLRSQVTDSQLLTLIHKTLDLADKVSKGIHILFNIRTKHSEGEAGDKPNMEISHQCVEVGNFTTYLFESVRQTNQRIEEILSGKE